MKVLIIQHEKSTPPGSTIEWCEKNKFEFQIHMAPEIKNWPSMDDFELLVVCGGSQNVDQEEIYPWLKTEKKFIAEAFRKNKKIVGLCLGGQLLAEVLGGAVQKHSSWVVGWFPVKMDDGKVVTAFQYHGYTFSLPPDAKLIASNENCLHQGFAMGGHAIGFQFHPETTMAWALECANDPELPTTGLSQSRDEIRNGVKNQPALQEWYFSRLDSLILNSSK